MKKIFMALGMMFLISCNQPEVKLAGEYKLIDAPFDAEITLSFDDKNFAGLAAVNRYFGSFEQKQNDIKFNVAGTTMMMGPENLMQAEQTYIKNLSLVKSFVLKNNTLVLKITDGTELRFKKI